MRRLCSPRSYPWQLHHSNGFFGLRTLVPSSANPSSVLARQAARQLHATLPTRSLLRPRRWQFHFRPVPSFGILLAAQLVLIVAVIHNYDPPDDIYPDGQSSLLNTSTFTSYTLAHKQHVSPNSCILTLVPSALALDEGTTSLNPFHILRSAARRVRNLSTPSTEQQIHKLNQYHHQLWNQGVWSVEIKQPQLMIARRYTPFPPPAALAAYAQSAPATGAANPEHINLFVRLEPQGEVSRYLHRLPEGSSVELRGGFPEYEIGKDVSDVVFIAGGTGIAPALSVARTLAWNGSRAQVRVLWANRRREDCIGGKSSDNTGVVTSLLGSIGLAKLQSIPYEDADLQEQRSVLVRQLDSLQAISRSDTKRTGIRFRAQYFVDEEGSFIRKADISRALQVQPPSIKDHPRPGRRLILVAGPDGFVEHIAGAKDLRNGKELQGSTGGLLGQLDLHGWEVWKL